MGGGARVRPQSACPPQPAVAGETLGNHSRGTDKPPWNCADVSAMRGGGLRSDVDALRFAEEIRVRVIQTGVMAYEDAAIQGLCCEGAWEVAVTAMRQTDLREVALQLRPRS